MKNLFGKTSSEKSHQIISNSKTAVEKLLEKLSGNYLAEKFSGKAQWKSSVEKLGDKTRRKNLGGKTRQKILKVEKKKN